MAIRFVCPSGHKLSAPESHAGKKARCPQCKQLVAIPELPERVGSAKPQQPATPQAKKQPPKKPPAKAAPKAEKSTGKPAPAAPAKKAASKPVKSSLEVVAAKPADETPKSPAPKPPARKPAASRKEKKESKAPPPLPPDGRKPGAEDAAKPKPNPSESKSPPKANAKPKPETTKSSAQKPPSPKSKAAKPAPADKSKPEPASRPKSEPETDPAKSTRAERRKSRRDRRRGRRDRKRESAASDSKDPDKSTGTPKRKRVRRQKRPATQYMPADVYRADQGKVQTVRWLALILAGVVLFSLAPVVGLKELDPQDAAGWARLAVALGALQLVFIVWMVNAPDWASVWIVMLVFAGVSTVYGMVTAITLATPVGEPIMLGMEPWRQQARFWCGAVLALMTMATYLCGRTAARWRRTFEAEMAGKVPR